MGRRNRSNGGADSVEEFESQGPGKTLLRFSAASSLHYKCFMGALSIVACIACKMKSVYV